jgi:mannan endo-1,4-beta-mannosidase
LLLCSPDERQGQFTADWLQSHLQAAKTINKPLLFEEFGKKLNDPNNAADIQKLRDPVYQAAYTAVENAIQTGEPLLGSMYWKWDTPTLPKGK